MNRPGSTPHPSIRHPSRSPRWLAAAVAWFGLWVAASAAPPGPVLPYESPAPLQPAGRIDELVFARLAKLGLTPAPLCSDAVFVRRVHLDLIGTLPTADEVRGFLADPAPDKRARLIDRLFERDEFADYWAMKWSDLLRVKAEFPINLWPNAAQCYHRWIRDAVRTNLPYDRFAHELLTASGSNFRVGPANFYRALQNRSPEAVGRTVALTFMGVRAERWPAPQQAALGVFFSRVGYKGTGEWKEEIVLFDAARPAPAGTATATFPDGTPALLPPDRDPREVFADWLVAPQNPWFARAIANRAWSWLLGRGIVHESDDLRPDNPPTHPELLAHLATLLVAEHYDLRTLFRDILNSRTYQLSSIPADDDPAAAANFAHYPLRRLDAEVLIDALNRITGTTEGYTSAIPEPFTFIPPEQRAIALPDGSVTSAFLEKFGRPPRDTGLDAERNNAITAPQRLHLLNSTHLLRKLEQGPALNAVLRGPQPVQTLFLTILSRPPTDEERRIVAEHFAAQPDKRQAARDVAWALINTAEFLHRH